MKPTTISKETNNSSITAILLAAGLSQRMGESNKLLMKINEVTMIEHAANQLVNSNLDQLIVVIGYQAELISNQIKKFKLELVYNADFEMGMGASIKAGLTAAKKDNHFMIVLSDMPIFSTEHYNKMINSFDQLEEKEITLATVNNKFRNPVIFPNRYLKELSEIENQKGAKTVVNKSQQSINKVEFTDERIFEDIDNHADYIRFSKF